MAGRSSYSDKDKARVYVALKANDNNVKRTSREMSVPENTVRRWRDEWASGINIPTTEAVEHEANSFSENAERVRALALEHLEKKIPDARPSELITIIGVLDDKITRVKGLDRDRNLHVHHHLPSSEEIQQLMGGFVKEAISKADDDVIEIQAEEDRLALPTYTP